MTNKEWLDYLAHNAPDELSAWFDAEHVETEEWALDGDTEPENEDSRERLEAEIESYSAFDMMDTITLDMVIGWLDRQAAITERKLDAEFEAACNSCATKIDLREEVDKLTAERDKLRSQICKLEDDLVRTSDERDNWKEHSRTIEYRCKKAETDCEIYRKKFGKCLDYTDAIHALMDDEGTA